MNSANLKRELDLSLSWMLVPLLLATFSLSRPARTEPVAEDQGAPVATIEVSSAPTGTSLGGELVEAKMTYRGDDYLLTLHGLSGGAGARGQVRNLVRPQDIAGFYERADEDTTLRKTSGVEIVFDRPVDLESGRLQIELTRRNTPKISQGHREVGVQ